MDNNLQLLEDYLDGNLSQSETKSVEEKLRIDPELRETMALLQASKQGIMLAGRRDSIRKIHQEFIQENKSSKNMASPKTRKISPWWMGIAASFTLVIAFATFSIFRFPNSFLEENVAVFELPTMRSAGNGMGELEMAFKNKDWDAVLEKVDAGETDQKALFLASMAALQQEKFESGLEYLNTLGKQNVVQAEPLFENEIAYYRLVFLLELRQYDKALEALDLLDKDEQNPYRASLGTMDRISLWLLGQF